MWYYLLLVLLQSILLFAQSGQRLFGQNGSYLECIGEREYIYLITLKTQPV